MPDPFLAMRSQIPGDLAWFLESQDCQAERLGNDIVRIALRFSIFIVNRVFMSAPILRYVRTRSILWI